MAYEFRTNYQSLVFWVVYCRPLFVLLSFLSLSHFIICSFPSNGLWLPLWELQFFLEYILQINFRGKDLYRAYIISDNCYKPYSYRHVETAYKIISSINIICFQSDFSHVNHVLYSDDVEKGTSREKWK
jgi:hypothetical protein